MKQTVVLPKTESLFASTWSLRGEVKTHFSRERPLNTARFPSRYLIRNAECIRKTV